MSSLRNKIIMSYGLSKIALLMFAAVVIADLHYLQTQIVEGEAVNDFHSATQEIRRDEKNLFLYHDPGDLFDLHTQIDTAENLFKNGRIYFLEVASEPELESVATIISEYRDTLEEYMKSAGAVRSVRQIDMRKLGHDLSTLAHDFSQRQRVALSHTTRVAVWTLVGALVTVIFLGIASAFFMVRQVVRPLGELEKQLDGLADGAEKNLNFISQDKEIQSFVHHFNSMLERLRMQQNQLRHHEKAAAMGILVSGVAHELNNPLSNISTSVQLLVEDDGSTRPELRQQWLMHIDGETERARRIVRRLLDSVRQPKLQMQAISAAKMVQSAVLLIHHQLAPNIFIHIEDIPENLIWVDRERLQQVFINLIRNAVDAGAQNIWVIGDVTTWAESMPANSENLHGEVNQISNMSAVMLFHITDDGPGIPADHLSQLFTPFFTTKSGGEGTGLGLYLVEEIISEHNGCLTVENRADGGTQFRIWLPMAEEDVSHE